MKISVSSGSLEILKKEKINEDSPTTLYLLTPVKCLNNCAFCIQAREVKREGFFLSRISWPPVDLEELYILMQKRGKYFKRICLQVTKTSEWENYTEEILKNLIRFNIPISISAPFEDINTISHFFSLGIDRINLSLDAGEKEIFEKIKEGRWEDRISLIEEASRIFPGKITTHIIVGLGEKEKNLIETISLLSNWKITIALFAFTPLSGTPISHLKPPEHFTYRKIQIITYLLQKRIISFKDLLFNEDKLILTQEILNLTYPIFPKIFKTLGCPYCNRPYYNESPKMIPYNFHRDLKEEEIKDIKRLLENESRSFGTEDPANNKRTL
ncbi:MAG TPA: radical SAM protein [Dictyoglomaceae bacterium]|nr:radical SAM protein [Dictyoglomaceae bacterium]HOL39161.1 radical SAM protein [Dictyoglomaceae bacterium]HOP94230.1 radical SAM protein [Dictyoglomaceae bacterium]HPP15315.1 radical SAM protein [Dictyoglomaceae bacterium]HPU42722.1 radical SAM protein [Dictyoglomaceae bacterium]